MPYVNGFWVDDYAVTGPAISSATYQTYPTTTLATTVPVQWYPLPPVSNVLPVQGVQPELAPLAWLDEQVREVCEYAFAA